MASKFLTRACVLVALLATALPAAAGCGIWNGADDYIITVAGVPPSPSSVPTLVKVTIHNPKTAFPSAAQYTVLIDGDMPVAASNQCPSKFAHFDPGPKCQDGPYPLLEGETDIYLV